MIFRLILSCLTVFSAGKALKILVIYPTPSFSHQRSIMALTERLVERGHKLFVISPNSVPELEQHDNYTFVDVSFSYKYFSDEKRAGYVNVQEQMSKWAFKDVYEPLANIPREQFLSEAFFKFQQRVKLEGIVFDVAIMETIFIPYACGMSRKLCGHQAAPLISMSSFSMDFYAEDGLGSVTHLSYVPSVMDHYTDRMSLWQRMENWFSHTYLMSYFKNTMEAAAKRFFRETYGYESEGLVDGCWRNVSLSLVTTNSLYFYPRLLGPNVIETGPMYLKAPQKLQKSLQDWLDGTQKGVIYFSLGSNFKSKSLSASARVNLMRFFKELPPGYRVLWKDELHDSTPQTADNVMRLKWTPQESILAHSKVILFITQGGLQSFQESVHFGVPMVGIPWFGDRMSIVSKMVDAKIGVHLLPAELHSFEKIKSAIESVLYDESFLRNVQRLSGISRDFSAVALDKGVFWVEHVAQFGAAHLRPSTADTTLFQYFCLDIIAVVITAASIIMFVFYSLLKLFWRFLSRKSNAKAHKS